MHRADLWTKTLRATRGTNFLPSPMFTFNLVLSCAPVAPISALDIRKCCADLVILQRAMKYVCSHCGADCETPLQCSRCKSVVYCGPACQRASWKAGKFRDMPAPRKRPECVHVNVRGAHVPRMCVQATRQSVRPLKGSRTLARRGQTVAGEAAAQLEAQLRLTRWSRRFRSWCTICLGAWPNG